MLDFVYEDVNECYKKNGGCQQECVNTPGSYKCGCRRGYTINVEDNTTCKGMGRYSSHTLMNVHASNSISILFSQISMNARHHSHVVSALKTFQNAMQLVWILLVTSDASVQMATGWTDRTPALVSHLFLYKHCMLWLLFICLFLLTDVDECLSSITNNCRHKCVNKPGSYECTCFKGFKYEKKTGTCEGNGLTDWFTNGKLKGLANGGWVERWLVWTNRWMGWIYGWMDGMNK